MKYYGQFELDKVLHQRYFQNKRNGFFVECGAYNGITECTCLFFEKYLGWTGINIEPLPEIFERLKTNRPNSTNLNVALSNQDVVATFTQAVHPELGMNFGNGSLSHTQDHKNQLVKIGCTFKEYKVQCKRFVDVFENQREIDLFVLDVEGHELSAIEGILKIDEKCLPKVFCIEFPQSGLDNIKQALSKHYNFDMKSHHNAMFVRA